MRPLARQLRPVDPIIVDQDSFILVRRRYRTVVEFRAGNPRVHRDGRGDPRQQHQRSAKYRYPDEGKETDDYCDVIEGGPTFSARSGLVTSRAPRVTVSHARSLCILSTDARIRSPPATLNAMLWPSAYTMPTVDDAKSRDLGKWTIPGSGILPGACRQLRHFGGSLAEPTQAN